MDTNNAPSRKTGDSVDRYYLFIMAVFIKISKGEKILINQLTDEFHVSKRVPPTMIDMGILSHGESLRYRQYLWTGGNPTREMAGEILKKASARGKAEYSGNSSKNSVDEENSWPAQRQEILSKLGNIENMLGRLVSELGA